MSSISPWRSTPMSAGRCAHAAMTTGAKARDGTMMNPEDMFDLLTRAVVHHPCDCCCKKEIAITRTSDYRARQSPKSSHQSTILLSVTRAMRPQHSVHCLFDG